MNKQVLGSAKRVDFDTNAIIYFMESNSTFQLKIAELWYALIEQGVEFVTSEIGVAECFYGAFKRQSAELGTVYERLFFQEDVFDIIPVSLALLIEAARLGASLGLRLVDAAHFQSAIISRCDILITNDQRFVSSHGVEVLYVSDL